MASVLITAVVTVLIALIGYWLTYRNNLRLTLRKERLGFVSEQLRDLYGPMLSIIESNGIAYQHFLSVYPPANGGTILWGREPTSGELEQWRDWIEQIVMPENRRLHELILTKAHLLRDEDMPSPLIDFCAHVTGWETVIRRWKQGDFSNHLSIVNYPPALATYVRSSYSTLKAQQVKTLTQLSGD